ncbi:MAG: hypothetical protein ACREQ5_01680 [Candidatus Dormibacteria bacterium]
MAEKKEVAKKEESEVVQFAFAEGRVGDAGLGRYLADDAKLRHDLTENRYAMMIHEIMSTDSVDDLLTPMEPENFSDYVGYKVRIDAISLNESDHEEGAPFYLSAYCVNEADGRKLVLNTGQQRAMGILIRAYQLGALPIRVLVEQSKRPNKEGNYMISFRKLV